MLEGGPIYLYPFSLGMIFFLSSFRLKIQIDNSLVACGDIRTTQEIRCQFKLIKDSNTLLDGIFPPRTLHSTFLSLRLSCHPIVGAVFKARTLGLRAAWGLLQA